jgi:hypothetical protein
MVMMIQRLLSVPLMVLLFVSSKISLSDAAAFLTPSTNTGTRALSSSTGLSLFSRENEDTQDNSLPQNFNPLNYKTNRSNSATSYSGTIISLRKTTMTELINELMNTDGESKEAMQPVLKQYQDFLLEPLEDTDAVLDPDSIYTPSMSRAERYRTYRASMEERVQSARNPAVKNVLEAMKEFVMGFEDETSSS